MADQPICILFCVDDRYLTQAGIALGSILESNPDTRFDVYLAAFDRDEERAESTFAPILARHPRCRLYFRDLDGDALFAGLHVTQQFSRSIYTRIVFDRFIDARHERVLYLDADILVCADLRPLWNTPLEGKALAAVPDHFRLDMDAIGFAEDEPYFNSGVLLIDRKAWRAGGFERDVLDILAREGKRLPWMDQDALNLALRGHVRFVGLEWNYQPRCADVPPEFLGLDAARYARLRARPGIIHFTTSQKPWNAAHRIHYAERFFQTARRFEMSRLLSRPRLRGLRDRGQQAKTLLRWHFPRAFRFLRRAFRPEAAALMYRAR